jgi:hypothetical protein
LVEVSKFSPELSCGEPPRNRLVACAILGHCHPPRLLFPVQNPYRELCARKGRLGRPFDLFVLLHISHCPEGVKQAPGRLVESILTYRRKSSGSLAMFAAILRASFQCSGQIVNQSVAAPTRALMIAAHPAILAHRRMLCWTLASLRCFSASQSSTSPRVRSPAEP